MANEITILTKEEIERNPSVIGENLAKLAMAIEDNRNDIESIKYRGFWKKLTNNNTRDLAEAMIKQNDTISALLTITQGIIFLSMSNIVVLGGIMDALNKHEATNQLRDNRYIEMAKDYLGEAIKSARKTKENEDEIIRVKETLASCFDNLDKQETLLKKLEDDLKIKASSDMQRDNTIKDLTVKISKIISINKQQNETILSLRNSLNEQARTTDQRLKLMNDRLLELTKMVESFGEKSENRDRQQDITIESTIQQLEKLELKTENYIKEIRNQFLTIDERSSMFDSLARAQEENFIQQEKKIIKFALDFESLVEERDRLSVDIDNIRAELKKRTLLGYAIGGIGILVGLASFLF